MQAEEAEMMEATMERIYMLLLMGVLLMFAICTSDKGEPR